MKSQKIYILTLTTSLTHGLCKHTYLICLVLRMNELWIVSVPGEQFQSFSQLSPDMGHHKSDFKVPELKVGTLDSLISLRYSRWLQ
jgi:hypothetical protein